MIRSSNRESRSSPSQRRRAIVLLAVLVVLVLLTLAAYQYAEMMSAEYRAVDSHRRAAQARALAESGIHYAAAQLANPSNISGSPYDNMSLFGGILVQQNDKPVFQGRFSVVSPLGPDDQATSTQPFRYGVTDEGGKINLNTILALDSSGQIAYNMLIKLPNMTQDVANAILDWIDPDDTPRANGAENAYYQSLTPPYRCKNGPLDSLEELLLVRGVTPQLLWGNDWNRNGILDSADSTTNGQLDLGWSAYLTIYSREQNVDSTGQPRIYINDPDLQGLQQKLTTAVGPALANYILAYRVYGPASTGGTGGGGGGAAGGGGGRGGASGTAGGTSGGAMAPAGRGFQMSTTMLGSQGGGSRARAISSLFELINTTVSIPSSDPRGQPTRYPSPLNDRGAQQQLLPILFDKVTTLRSAEIPGRININTAPAAVLATLPGLSDTDVQNILSHRPSISGTDTPDPNFQTPAWLLTEANLTPTKLQALDKYVTTRSQVYRLQSVGYFDGGGPTARIEAVIDINSGKPRIVHWRDLTELGKGFDLSATTTPK
jgi:type II secretory pathway component PulK